MVVLGHCLPFTFYGKLKSHPLIVIKYLYELTCYMPEKQTTAVVVFDALPVKHAHTCSKRTLVCPIVTKAPIKTVVSREKGSMLFSHTVVRTT